MGYKETAKYWDSKVPEIKRMMIATKRLREIAEHLGVTLASLKSAIRSREISAVRLRYEAKKRTST